MIIYRPVFDTPTLEAITDLEVLIWQMHERGAVPAHMMFVIHHCGGNLIGAFDTAPPDDPDFGDDDVEIDERLIGFTMALPDVTQSPPRLWSHMAAVHPDYQNRGIGAALKYVQRDWALQNGYTTIGWTFDPLMRLNAYFNLRRLGATAHTYRINFYGTMNDGINAGMPSDRLEMHWQLDSSRVLAHLSGPPQAYPNVPPDAPFLLRVNNNQSPKITLPDALTQPCYAVEIPYDTPAMRRDNWQQSLQWRFALRQVMMLAFTEGYEAVDFVVHDKRGWYILKRREDG